MVNMPLKKRLKSLLESCRCGVQKRRHEQVLVVNVAYIARH